MKKLRILYLPNNLASMPGITAESMNKLEGVEAICLSYGQHQYTTPSKSTKVIKAYSKKLFFHYIGGETKKYYHFLKLILWADVIHYVWDSFLPFQLDLRLIKLLNKPGVIEWLGSEIRCPSKAFPINNYLKEVFDKGYEYTRFEKDKRSLATQISFKKIGFEPACCPEMLLYVEPHLFKHVHLLMQRINAKSFAPKYPDKKQGKLLIVHSPSAKIAKGSDSIIAVMNELEKEYDFTFILIHNQPREKVLSLIKEADIFIDQLVVGGYGMAAMEAMSFGKPVMCYLMPELFKMGLPAECPIVNTTKENIREKVVELIKNAELRYQLGVAGRQYIEKYHDADSMAPLLLQLYKEVIKRASQKNVKNNVV